MRENRKAPARGVRCADSQASVRSALAEPRPFRGGTRLPPPRLPTADQELGFSFTKEGSMEVGRSASTPVPGRGGGARSSHRRIKVVNPLTWREDVMRSAAVLVCLL